MDRPCKVLHAPTGRYAAGHTSDLSRGGVLLELHWARVLRPGDDIEVFIAWSDRTILQAQDGIRGCVRRVLTATDGRQMVGVEFAEDLAERWAAAA